MGCGSGLVPGTAAAWNKERREATCESCVLEASPAVARQPEIDRGEAGASAAREGQRRRQKREAMIKAAHPRLGSLILAASDEPRSTKSWERGAIGEQKLGAHLNSLREAGLAVLHDRRIPGSRANIDHIVIGPSGVFIIDSKRYTGKVEQRDAGWILGRDWRLYVNGRNQTPLVEAMSKQVAAVRRALSSTLARECKVNPVLCFVDARWDVFATSFRFGDVQVLPPKKLIKLVRGQGDLGHAEIAELERLLAQALPAA